MTKSTKIKAKAPEPLSDSESEKSESVVSMNSEDILENDVLYFLLSKLLKTKDGKNIADVLEEINQKLGAYLKSK
jgi:hypothetical protein